jgi:hypothetical protein
LSPFDSRSRRHFFQHPLFSHSTALRTDDSGR